MHELIVLAWRLSIIWQRYLHTTVITKIYFYQHSTETTLTRYLLNKAGLISLSLLENNNALAMCVRLFFFLIWYFLNYFLIRPCGGPPAVWRVQIRAFEQAAINVMSSYFNSTQPNYRPSKKMRSGNRSVIFCKTRCGFYCESSDLSFLKSGGKLNYWVFFFKRIFWTDLC